MVTVTRAIYANGCTITETASAPLLDDLAMDDIPEARRRAFLAQCLFNSLPSLQPKQIPSCPLHLPN